jgi:hypothetical protein
VYPQPCENTLFPRHGHGNYLNWERPMASITITIEASYLLSPQTFQDPHFAFDSRSYLLSKVLYEWRSRRSSTSPDRFKHSRRTGDRTHLHCGQRPKSPTATALEPFATGGRIRATKRARLLTTVRDGVSPKQTTTGAEGGAGSENSRILFPLANRASK